jgi:hypothetical protein
MHGLGKPTLKSISIWILIICCNSFNKVIAKANLFNMAEWIPTNTIEELFETALVSHMNE